MLAWPHTHALIHSHCRLFFRIVGRVSFLLNPRATSLYQPTSRVGLKYGRAALQQHFHSRTLLEPSNQLPYTQVDLARWPRHVRYKTVNDMKFKAHEPHKNFRTLSSNRRTIFFTRTHSETRTTLPTTPPRGLIILRDQLLEPTPHRSRM